MRSSPSSKGVEKPGNLGAVLRSADGAGVDAVIAASPRTDLFNPNAIRASAGTVFTVPLAAAPTSEVLHWLRDRGLRIVAARVDAERLYTDVDLTGPIALVLGAEAEGLGGAWAADDIEAVRLPMLGVADSLNVSVSAAILFYEARRQRDLAVTGTKGVTMETVRLRDHRRRTGRRGGRVQGARARCDGRDHRPAVVRWQLPAHRLPARRSRSSTAPRGITPTPPPTTGRRRRPHATSWSTARRTRPNPTTASHVEALAEAGAVVYRGDGAIIALAAGSASGTTTRRTTWRRTNVVVAVGSVSKRPPIEGIDEIPTWTNREATLTRELPKSLLVLGGGPTGCELAQVYVRFGVPTTIVQSGPRLAPTDHPRNSEVDPQRPSSGDGVIVRTGVRALRARAGAGHDGAHVIELDDGSTAEGHAILLAVGRSFPLEDLGLEHYGIDTTGRTPFPRDGRLRIARRPVGHRRPGRTRAAHPSGRLPG